MKKLTCVAVILVCLLTMAGVDAAQAKVVYVPKTLELRINGVPYADGATVAIKSGIPLKVDLYPGDANRSGSVTSDDFNAYTVSDDETVTVEGVLPNVTGVTVLYNLLNFNLSSPAVTLLGTATLQSTSLGLNAVVPLSISYTASTSGLLWTPASSLHLLSADPWNILFPKKIIFTDKNYKKLESIRLEGMESREVYLVADDANRDGVVNANDYLQPLGIAAEYESTLTTDDSIAHVSMSTLTLLSYPEGTYPRRLATVTVTGIQPTGGESEVLYADVSYELSLNYTDPSEETHDLTTTDTPVLTVSVYPKDDGGDGGENGGGSCSLFGAGALLFLAVPLMLRRKSA